jgi:hypothetical protein
MFDNPLLALSSEKSSHSPNSTLELKATLEPIGYQLLASCSSAPPCAASRRGEGGFHSAHLFS